MVSGNLVIGTAGNMSHLCCQAVPVMRTEISSIRMHLHPLEQDDHLTIGHHTIVDLNLS